MTWFKLVMTWLGLVWELGGPLVQLKLSLALPSHIWLVE